MVDMYVAKVPNRGSPPAILLRESYREDGKVKNRTLANLSHWPQEKVTALSLVLKGSNQPSSLVGSFSISRSLPHGAVALALGMGEKLGLPELIDPTPSRLRTLVYAMVISSVIAPGSKLSMARSLRDETATSSLGTILGLSACDEDDLYQAMDYLYSRQKEIERSLADKHLEDGILVLYDISSAAFEGRCCPLGEIGYPKDGVKGRLQITYGLLCSKEGIPIAIEVFSGATAEPTTLATQVAKIKERFSLSEVCLVGDRGMMTRARIKEDLSSSGLRFITALRSVAIKELIHSGALQLSLFEETDLFSLTHPDYEGERLVACKNPLLEVERRRKREELLSATEKALTRIKDATLRERRPLRGSAATALRVGKVINRYKVAKHFTYEVTDASFTFARNEEKIQEEQALDGIYVLRTDVSASQIADTDVVRSYKALAQVERVFRTMNTELEIRPIRHYSEERVRAHVFLSMCSYYLSFHLKEALAPLLFKDDHKEDRRTSPVAPKRRSAKADRKAATKMTPEQFPVHSFQSLLGDLGTICANTITPEHASIDPFVVITTPTPLQAKAFALVGTSHKMGYL